MYVWIDLHIGDENRWFEQQSDISGYAVPVALCLVCHAVRVLPHAHILYTIIYIDVNIIVVARFGILSNLKHMRHRECGILAHTLSVDHHGGFYVRSLQRDEDAPFLPFLWNENGASISCMPRVMPIGGEKEGKLALPIPTIFLHVWIEIENDEFPAQNIFDDINEKTYEDIYKQRTQEYSLDTKSKSLHSTQKPIQLCDRLIKASSNENDLIYIPFAGSGSEIISCINNNRNYLATEINKKYIDEIIIPRIENNI